MLRAGSFQSDTPTSAGVGRGFPAVKTPPWTPEDHPQNPSESLEIPSFCGCRGGAKGILNPGPAGLPPPPGHVVPQTAEVGVSVTTKPAPLHFAGCVAALVWLCWLCPAVFLLFRDSRFRFKAAGRRWRGGEGPHPPPCAFMLSSYAVALSCCSAGGVAGAGNPGPIRFE